MNKLDFTTYPGDGMPLLRSTLMFANDGFMEAFAAFLKAFDTNDVGGNIYRLAGCDFTFTGGGNTLDITDGFILKIPPFSSAPAEIYKVAAQTVTKTGGQIFQFTFAEIPDGTLDPIYNALGVPFNMHVNTVVTVVASAAGLGLVSISDEANPYLREMLGGTWRAFNATTGDFTPDTGTVTVTAIAYRYKLQGKNLEIMVTGNINVTSGSPTYIQIVVPGGATLANNNIGAAYCGGACSIRSALGNLILEPPAALAGASNFFQAQIKLEMQ